MAKYKVLGKESWRDLIADEPIIYSNAELLKLREAQKIKWTSYLHKLWASDFFKNEMWNFEGSENWHCAVFEPHHYKEGIYTPYLRNT